MSSLKNNNAALEALIEQANALPIAITVDATLTQEGAAADAKATGDKLANHTQAASSITEGTFAGAVVAPRTGQICSSYMLRNSKIASSATNPSYNGEICWTYE